MNIKNKTRKILESNKYIYKKDDDDSSDSSTDIEESEDENKDEFKEIIIINEKYSIVEGKENKHILWEYLCKENLDEKKKKLNNLIKILEKKYDNETIENVLKILEKINKKCNKNIDNYILINIIDNIKKIGEYKTQKLLIEIFDDDYILLVSILAEKYNCENYKELLSTIITIINHIDNIYDKLTIASEKYIFKKKVSKKLLEILSCLNKNIRCSERLQEIIKNIGEKILIYLHQKSDLYKRAIKYLLCINDPIILVKTLKEIKKFGELTNESYMNIGGKKSKWYTNNFKFDIYLEYIYSYYDPILSLGTNKKKLFDFIHIANLLNDKKYENKLEELKRELKELKEKLKKKKSKQKSKKIEKKYREKKINIIQEKINEIFKDGRTIEIKNIENKSRKFESNVNTLKNFIDKPNQNINIKIIIEEIQKYLLNDVSLEEEKRKEINNLLSIFINKQNGGSLNDYLTNIINLSSNTYDYFKKLSSKSYKYIYDKLFEYRKKTLSTLKQFGEYLKEQTDEQLSKIKNIYDSFYNHFNKYNNLLDEYKNKDNNKDKIKSLDDILNKDNTTIFNNIQIYIKNFNNYIKILINNPIFNFISKSKIFIEIDKKIKEFYKKIIVERDKYLVREKKKREFKEKYEKFENSKKYIISAINNYENKNFNWKDLDENIKIVKKFSIDMTEEKEKEYINDLIKNIEKIKPKEREEIKVEEIIIEKQIISEEEKLNKEKSLEKIKQIIKKYKSEIKSGGGKKIEFFKSLVYNTCSKTYFGICGVFGFIFGLFKKSMQLLVNTYTGLMNKLKNILIFSVDTLIGFMTEFETLMIYAETEDFKTGLGEKYNQQMLPILDRIIKTLGRIFRVTKNIIYSPFKYLLELIGTIINTAKDNIISTLLRVMVGENLYNEIMDPLLLYFKVIKKSMINNVNRNNIKNKNKGLINSMYDNFKSYITIFTSTVKDPKNIKNKKKIQYGVSFVKSFLFTMNLDEKHQKSIDQVLETLDMISQNKTIQILPPQQIQNISLEKQNISLEKQNISLGGRHISLEKQNISLEKQNISLEKQNISLEKQNISLGGRHISLEKKNISLEKQKGGGDYINFSFLNGPVNLFYSGCSTIYKFICFVFQKIQKLVSNIFIKFLNFFREKYEKAKKIFENSVNNIKKKLINYENSLIEYNRKKSLKRDVSQDYSKLKNNLPNIIKPIMDFFEINTEDQKENKTENQKGGIILAAVGTVTLSSLALAPIVTGIGLHHIYIKIINIIKGKTMLIRFALLAVAGIFASSLFGIFTILSRIMRYFFPKKDIKIKNELQEKNEYIKKLENKLLKLQKKDCNKIKKDYEVSKKIYKSENIKEKIKWKDVKSSLGKIITAFNNYRFFENNSYSKILGGSYIQDKKQILINSIKMKNYRYNNIKIKYNFQKNYLKKKFLNNEISKNEYKYMLYCLNKYTVKIINSADILNKYFIN